jgi:uncharacterized protein YdeI (YjbR/CyaY-like superfamily)
MTARPDKPRAFSTPAALRAWLEKHHRTKAELTIRLYKRHAQHRGVTYPQALDEALCYGWIDGVRRSVDADSFSTRFTPRRARSIWSAINIRRARELVAEGRMQPSGRAAFQAHDPKRSGIYSYESLPRELDPSYTERLKANTRAWKFHRAQPPWYRRTSAYWIMSAKREETRGRRLEILIACSARGVTIPPLTRPVAKKVARRAGRTG